MSLFLINLLIFKLKYSTIFKRVGGGKMSKIIQKTEFFIGNALIEIVLQRGFSEQGVHRSTDLHFHPNFEVHYIENGSFVFRCEDTKTTVDNNTLIIIPPKLYHAFRSESADIRRLSFEFRISELKKASEAFTEYEKLFSSLDKPTVYNGVLLEFEALSKCMGVIEGDEEICRLNATLTIAFLKICDILRSYTNNHKFKNPTASAKASPSDEDITVIKILSYIASNCRRPLKLREVANAANMSERQLQRILSTRIGGTFHEILIKNRIAVAKELMSDKLCTLSLEKISFECGFSNYVSFWMQFKKLTGKTPELYRKTI